MSGAAEQLNHELLLSTKFFPWHKQQKEMLMDLTRSGRMHHAFLIYGPGGVGKFDFACAAAASLFCENPIENEACGSCKACVLFQAGTHPDFYLLKPEDEGKQIVIDEVRALVSFMSKSSSKNGKRIVVIDESDQLNNAASNALLKFLEEPGDDVHLFLVCQQIENLLPTINSRCQKLGFSNIEKSAVAHWLESQDISPSLLSNALFEFANGSPVDALDLIDSQFFLNREEILNSLYNLLSGNSSLLETFRQLDSYELQVFLKYWYGWCLDLIKLKANAEIDQLRFQSMLHVLEQILDWLDERALPVFMDRLLNEMSQLKKGSSVNQALLLQDLLVSWKALSSKS